MTSPALSVTPSRDSLSAGYSASYDLGLLIIRVAVGLTMAVHGVQKLFGWFDGGGISGTGKFFEMAGYPSGEAMAVIAGLSETFGGLGLALGLLTPLAGAVLLGTLINILGVKGLEAFTGPKGVEYELLLTAAVVGIILTGPGRYAVDRFLPYLRTPRPWYAPAALLLGVVVGFVVVLFVRD
ncbi:DoxX family protein [Streptomyces sp. NPDC090022]|uniref:DoxX family protein n=1 Tax=Streptomyces sp. NPDC090022 TaxID=3365920 RepID=UPI00382F26AF